MLRVAVSPDELLAALGDEALGAAALMQRLGCSQPTLSRMVRAAGESVAMLGRAQQTRYARVRATGAEQPIVVTRIDANGAPQSCGVLHAVGQMSGSRTAWVAERRVEVFAGLPWFVADMRPQGFIGRQFPARVPHLGLPPGAGDWSDNHVLQALCAAGADEPGDLILGRAALDLFLREATPEPITPRRKATVYAQTAAQAHDIIAQSGNRSSAGGEQAKFTAYVQTSAQTSAGAAHVLVKFSPAGTDPVAQRWRDLLRAEHHALSVLSENAADNGLHAAQTQFIDADRLYLEVRRFDRIGARGRSGVVSLGAIDDGFVGQRQSWVQTAQQLQRQRLLREADVQRIGLLQAFGRLIHNTDMHFGNCALLHEGPGSSKFTLAPVYDMLPMRFAPTTQGLREVAIPPVLPTADVLPMWAQALGLARAFWTRVLDDGEISRGFVKIARAAMP